MVASVDHLKDVLLARSVQPFTAYVGDGRELYVNHPEMMAIFPHGRSIVVALREGGHRIIDVLPVTGVLVGNGRRRGPRRKKS